MKKITFLFLLFVVSFASCKKECTGATIEITNRGDVQLTVYIPDGSDVLSLDILPNESESYQLPADAWQVPTHYRWAGDETMHEFVTVAEPCETVEIELQN